MPDKTVYDDIIEHIHDRSWLSHLPYSYPRYQFVPLVGEWDCDLVPFGRGGDSMPTNFRPSSGMRYGLILEDMGECKVALMADGECVELVTANGDLYVGAHYGWPNPEVARALEARFLR